MENQDRGHLLFLTCLVTGLYQALDDEASEKALAALALQVEQARAALLGNPLPEGLLESFDFHAQQWLGTEPSAE